MHKALFMNASPAAWGAALMLAGLRVCTACMMQAIIDEDMYGRRLQCLLESREGARIVLF